MQLGWNDLVVDKQAVQATAERLIDDWRWLIDGEAEPLLPTACGDLLLRLPDGAIAFLDTYEGSFETVAASYEQWKTMLHDPARQEAWFRVGLLGDLLEAGLTRGPGQCFSPFVPQVINGSWEPHNFAACDLVVHLSMLGQIHQQVKDLPPGTKISGFQIEEE